VEVKKKCDATPQPYNRLRSTSLAARRLEGGSRAGYVFFLEEGLIGVWDQKRMGRKEKRRGTKEGTGEGDDARQGADETGTSVLPG
jgi:hypothetical protein